MDTTMAPTDGERCEAHALPWTVNASRSKQAALTRGSVEDFYKARQKGG